MCPKVREIYNNLQSSKTVGKKTFNVEETFMFFKLFNKSANFQKNKIQKSCFCCNCNIEDEPFILKNWQQMFILKSNFNFEPPNLMYVTIPSGSNKEYLEKTGEQLK